MNVGGVVGGTMAAIIAKQQQDVVSTFRRASATSASTARPLAELGIPRHSVFEMMQRKGVVVATGDGRFYLDEVAQASAQRHSQRLVLVLLLTFGVALLVFFAAKFI